MPSYFCITVRFLDLLSHARGEGGEPEWPPSPLRLFQSLVAASAARWNERRVLRHAVPALRWLEGQQAPTLVAAAGEPSHVRYRLYVPDNVGDRVAASWSRGGTSSIAGYRTEKDVGPTHLKDSAVHYLFPLTDGDPNFAQHYDTLVAASRSITHLGWGVDMVAATAAVVAEGDAAKLSGERWQPTSVASADQRRVPTHGTLDELLDRHKAFLDRVRRDANGNEWFNPVPSLSTFRVVGYRLPTDPAWRLGASFNILKPDTSSRKAFDTASAALKVAGMVRCAAKLAAKDSGGTWTEEKINAFILGHGESNDGGGHVAVGPQRFAYLPLPTIESRGKGNARVVGSVRRVMLYCFAEGCEDEIIWAQRILSGQELVDKDKGQAVALLSVIPSNEKVVRCYAQAAATWATVTPVVLPGYDDPNHYRRRLKKGASSDEQKRLLESLDARIDGLLRKAIVQAGFCQELADHAQLDWRKVGFWPGTDLADRYGVPDHLKRFPRFHVKVGWRDARNQPVEIPGPVCFGGGRFYGLGLFAAYQ